MSVQPVLGEDAGSLPIIPNNTNNYSNSSEQVIGSPRRSISDPVVSPRDKRKERAATPYPSAAEKKQAAAPSRIPRFTPQQRTSRPQIQIIKSRKPPGVPIRRNSSRTSTSLKTIFYPKKSRVGPPAVTVYQPPRPLLLTPSDEDRDLVDLYRNSSPVRSLDKSNSSSIRACPNTALKPAIVHCSGGIYSCRFPTRPPTPRTATERRSSRDRRVLDDDGYIQGPHTTHNKHTELYGQPPPRSADIVFPETHPCYGLDPPGGLPPLPRTRGKGPTPDNINRSFSRTGTGTLETSSVDLFFGHNFESRAPSRGLILYPPKSPSSSSGILVNQPDISVTSLLSRVHETVSVTDLHPIKNKKNKLTCEPSEGRIKCPLCSASKANKCSVHRRTMSSRYLTDLEWRICNAVNIYVYRNGEEGQSPVLVHIPPSRKKSMRSVMAVIQERISYPIGYAKYLYRMNGKRVTSPCELEMYNNYVVASNYDRIFKSVSYARRRSPLLVLAKESKHVRELRLKTYQYEMYLAKRRAALGGEDPMLTDKTDENISSSDIHNLLPPPMQHPQRVQPVPGHWNGQWTFRAAPGVGTVTISTKSPGRKKQTGFVEQENEGRRAENYRPPYEFTVQPGNVNAAQLRNPVPAGATVREESVQNVQGSQEGSFEIPGGRFKALMKDEESLFYSSRKNKPNNKGVLDVNGGKQIFYQDPPPAHCEAGKPTLAGDSQNNIETESAQTGQNQPVMIHNNAPGDNKAQYNFQPDNSNQSLQEQFIYSNSASTSQSPSEKITPESDPSNLNIRQGTGDGRLRNESSPHLSVTPRKSNIPTSNHFLKRHPQEQSLEGAKIQNPPAPHPHLPISAPSRSYTILPIQSGSGASAGKTTRAAGAYQEDRKVFRVAGVEPTVAPPSRVALSSQRTTRMTQEAPTSTSLISSYFEPGLFGKVYTGTGDGMYVLAGTNSNGSTYYTTAAPSVTHTSYLPVPQPPAQPTSRTPPTVHPRVSYPTQGATRQQILVVPEPRNQPVLNNGGHIGKNSHSSDEVDIPFTPPSYAGSEQVLVFPYASHPVFLGCPRSNLRLGNVEPIPSGGSNWRSSGSHIPIRKPSRRNVAIQMGEPTTTDPEFPARSRKGILGPTPQPVFLKQAQHWMSSSTSSHPPYQDFTTTRSQVRKSPPQRSQYQIQNLQPPLCQSQNLEGQAQAQQQNAQQQQQQQQSQQQIGQQQQQSQQYSGQQHYSQQQSRQQQLYQARQQLLIHQHYQDHHQKQQVGAIVQQAARNVEDSSPHRGHGHPRGPVTQSNPSQRSQCQQNLGNRNHNPQDIAVNSRIPIFQQNRSSNQGTPSEREHVTNEQPGTTRIEPAQSGSPYQLRRNTDAGIRRAEDQKDNLEAEAARVEQFRSHQFMQDTNGGFEASQNFHFECDKCWEERTYDGAPSRRGDLREGSSVLPPPTRYRDCQQVGGHGYYSRSGEESFPGPPHAFLQEGYLTFIGANGSNNNICSNKESSNEFYHHESPDSNQT